MSSPARTLIRAGLTTAVVDGIFSSVLSAFFYGSTVARLWKGVASVPLGPSALDGGADMVAVGLALHVTTAFTWSAVFLFGAMRLDWIRRLLESRYGVAKVAAIFGPFVWLVMSLVVIPTFTQRAPAFTIRWLIQLIGHAPFVGGPIVASVSASRVPASSSGASPG